MTGHPPQITENEAEVWKALSRAVDHAEWASLALARAQQRMGDDQHPLDGPWWRLAADMLRTVGTFASDTLAERQIAARQPNAPAETRYGDHVTIQRPDAELLDLLVDGERMNPVGSSTWTSAAHAFLDTLREQIKGQ